MSDTEKNKCLELLEKIIKGEISAEEARQIWKEFMSRESEE